MIVPFTSIITDGPTPLSSAFLVGMVAHGPAGEKGILERRGQIVCRECRRDAGPDEGVINGPDDAREAVRQRYKEGADLIKLTATGGVLSLASSGDNPQFTNEELEAVVRTARDYNFTVAVHAHGTEGMKRAVLAGVTSIEHGTYMTEEVMALMVERGTYLVPTLMAGAPRECTRPRPPRYIQRLSRAAAA